MKRTVLVLLSLGFALCCQNVARGVGLEGLERLRDGRSRRATSTARDKSGSYDPTSNWDNRLVKSGESRTLADLKGPGIIRHIWITFPDKHPSWISKAGCADPSEIVLRMYWDGREKPDVESPLGDFFAGGFGMRMPVNSVPVQVENGRSYNCFWPMPFRKSARIVITNESKRPLVALYWNIDWVEKESLPPDTAHFCAQYRREFPCEKGSDYLILDGVGRGHYVGTVLSVRSRSPQWFGEGDEKIYIDGERTASIWGTGTEDYFLCAWGLRECGFPFFGVPYTNGVREVGKKTVAYRWHISDPLVFGKSIRVTIEHYGWISADETPDNKINGFTERTDDYASVAFWYQVGPSKKFTTLPSAENRKLPEIDVIFAGRDYREEIPHGVGKAVVQKGYMWTNNAQILYRPPEAEGAWLEVPFTVAKYEPKCLALVLTHSYDFGTYQVSLDSKLTGNPLNLYSPETTVKEHHIGNLWIKPGRHVVRLECVGKDPRSSQHWLGFDSLRLRQRREIVSKYAHDREGE